MTSILADTHAIIWYIEASERLSSAALNVMRSAIQSGGVIYVSAISMVEIVYLTEKRRIPIEIFDRMTLFLERENYGFKEVPFNSNMALAMRKIPANIVPDMPDRMISATALYLDVPLITCDRKIRSAPLITIW